MKEQKEKVILTREEVNLLEAQAEELIYRVHSLALIQEGYLIDAIEMLKNAGVYRFNIKRDIDNMKRISGNLRHQVYAKNQHDLESVEFFGEESDMLKVGIDAFFEKMINSLKEKDNEKGK